MYIPLILTYINRQFVLYKLFEHFMTCRGCSRCCNNIAGSGVLILTDSKTFPGEYDVVLVKDYTETYNDTGGKSDGLESTVTASKELYEETRGVVAVDSHVLTTTRYVDIGSNSRHKYRCYVIYIPQLSCNQYYLIDTTHMSSAFRETSGMTRFPVRHIRDLVRRGQLGSSVYDDKSIQRPINDRVRDVLNILYR